MSHLGLSDNDVMSHTELLKLFATLEKNTTTLARTTVSGTEIHRLTKGNISHSNETLKPDRLLYRK